MSRHGRTGVALALALTLGATGCSPDGTTPSGDAGHIDAGVSNAPYAVAVTIRTLVDSTRPTPQNGSEPAKSNRTLPTNIWYPTTGAADPPAMPVRDGPLAPGGPYPLVLFVHASGSTRLVYTYLTVALARAGYVVAAADFPLTAIGTPGGSSDLHVTDEVGDLSFLCDQLKATSLDAGDTLRGAVDGLHYAVVGHSTGGAVAELAAFAGDDAMIKHDARVSAVVPLSGDACMFNAAFFTSRGVPIFVIGATNDLFVRLPNSGQWVFDSTPAPHLLAKLIGGQHQYFTDINLPDALLNPVPTDPSSTLSTTLSAYGVASECLLDPPGGTDPALAFDRQHELVIQLVRAYLDAQMRDRPAALQAAIGANDPAVVFQQ